MYHAHVLIVKTLLNNEHCAVFWVIEKKRFKAFLVRTIYRITMELNHSCFNAFVFVALLPPNKESCKRKFFNPSVPEAEAEFIRFPLH